MAAGVRLRLDRRRRLAMRYAEAGWPVVPGAWWDRSRYRCGGVECSVSGLHVAGHTGLPSPGSAGSVPAAADALPVEVVARWSERPHTLLVATGSVVDALELPALATGAVEHGGALGVPVARLPTGRWLLFAATAEGGMDSWAPTDPQWKGLLLHGQQSLVPLPPSLLLHGRVRWRSRPDLSPDRLPPMADLLGRVLPLLSTTIETSDHPAREVRQGLAPAAWARG